MTPAVSSKCHWSLSHFKTMSNLKVELLSTCYFHDICFTSKKNFWVVAKLNSLKISILKNGNNWKCYCICNFSELWFLDLEVPRIWPSLNTIGQMGLSTETRAVKSCFKIQPKYFIGPQEMPPTITARIWEENTKRKVKRDA